MSAETNVNVDCPPGATSADGRSQPARVVSTFQGFARRIGEERGFGEMLPETTEAQRVLGRDLEPVGYKLRMEDAEGFWVESYYRLNGAPVGFETWMRQD